MLRRSDLHKYQHKAIEFILQHKKCALFLAMGMGKSVSTLTAITELLEAKCIKRVLIIAPLRVANSVWKNEALKWEHLNHLKIEVATGTPSNRIKALKSDADIIVINRENISWLTSNFKWGFDMLVVDESSSFKSAKSQRFKSLKKVDTKYCVLLTGTPTPQSLMDLWSQFFLLDSGVRLGRTITAFRNRFFSMGGYGGYTYTLNKGSDRIIHELIDDISLSMSAEDYLDMPDRVDVVEEVTLPPAVRKQYKTLQDEFVLEIGQDEVNVLSAAALGNKLLQLGNGFMYTEDKKAIVIHDEKLKALAEIIDDNPSENILVFYNFKADLDALKAKFKRGVELDKKGEAIKAWNDNKIKLLFAQPASASMGINLQDGGCVAVWFGLNWNLEYYLQGNARIYRQGQGKPVTIIHLVVKGGMDEKIMKALESKATTQKELLERLT